MEADTHSNYKHKIDYSTTVGSVDGTNPETRISLKEFYSTHVAQSIPLKFKGYANDWKIYKEVREAVGKDEAMS